MSKDLKNIAAILVSKAMPEDGELDGKNEGKKQAIREMMSAIKDGDEEVFETSLENFLQMCRD